jgi:IstB-like ATP binding protein
MSATTTPALAPDLTEGLKRLKLAAMRRLAPELLVTAKTQRWTPEEFLRTLIEAEIAARDASNARNRMRAAAFPVAKTLTEFDVSASSIPKATFDYLASLEWIRAAENTCLIVTSWDIFGSVFSGDVGHWSARAPVVGGGADRSSLWISGMQGEFLVAVQNAEVGVLDDDGDDLAGVGSADA